MVGEMRYRELPHMRLRLQYPLWNVLHEVVFQGRQ
jgi:hypothetical protein